MNTRMSTFVFSALAIWLGAAAATSAQQLDTIAISPVKANPSVEQAATKAGKSVSLQRVVEALDGQLQSAVHGTRRFEVVSRSDLDSVLLEQAFAESGNVDNSDSNSSESFKLRGAKYVLVAGIDDFQDHEESATFAALGKTATRRVIRFSAVARIVDSTTGTLLETANFQIRNQDVSQAAASVSSDGQLSDELLVAITRMMAEKIAVRVVDVVFPARVIGLTGPQVTINRGDGTGIKENDTWEVFALGEEMIDPDTGVSYGREEVMVGTVRVTRVRPQFSTAEIVEDAGITRGAVVRRLVAEQ